ncbi:MAG: PIG-L family deacetylase [Armatimonadetes bacterium]|nr:PIG-L family deacetylase [Armatimonadota bacterium]
MKVWNNRVLALMPHPDDMEILCGGTLIRLADAGVEVHVATMTAGDMGSAEIGRDEIAAIRRAEAAAGAQAVGAASYTCLEFGDVDFVFDSDARRRVAGMLRKVDAGLVITTPPYDYMFDHIVTSQLVRDACFNAPMRNYETPGRGSPTSGVPYLVYTDALEGHDMFGAECPLSFAVDISDVLERKLAALACHASQRDWLRRQHGMDNYIESARRWSGIRGPLAGGSHAEAFRQHLGHPHPADNPLSRLAGVVDVQTA